MKSLIKRILFLLFPGTSRILPNGRKYEFDPVIESLALRAKTREEVAEEYGFTVKTLNVKLKEENIYVPPGVILPKTLKTIYNALGLPPGLKNT
jgi:hypothetical protein